MGKRVIFGAVVVFVGAIAIFASYGLNRSTEVAAENFTEQRVQLPAVQFVDQDGAPVTLADAIKPGDLVVISFNYTTCQSICPMTNEIMARVDQALESHKGRPVRLFSISIDPATDTPEKITKARRDFSPSSRWVWLTGQQRSIDTIVSVFDAAVYDIELHDPVFVIGDPASGIFVKSLSMPEPEEVMSIIRQFDA